MMTPEEQQHALVGYDQDTYALWLATLNHWRWPDDFPIPEPDGFANAPMFHHDDLTANPCPVSKRNFMRVVWTFLQARVTEYDFLRVSHCLLWPPDIRQTNDEFDAWWAARS